MDTLQSVIDQLKAAGLTPHVTVQIFLESADPAALQTLKANLEAVGVPLDVQVHLNLDPSVQTPATLPGIDKTGPTFMVMVTENKTNCMTFTKKDGGGKPIMEIREPRIQLMRNTRFAVSADIKVGDKDQGDGTVIGNGGLKYYYVIDCAANREAEGLFVKQEDVQRG